MQQTSFKANLRLWVESFIHVETSPGVLKITPWFWPLISITFHGTGSMTLSPLAAPLCRTQLMLQEAIF